MLRLTLVIAALLSVVSAYSCTCNSNDECTNIPSNNVYYLTSFCDQQTACGPSCGNCMSYYAADAQRFGCGGVLSCTRNGHNANLKVIDSGPACWVENDAGMPIIDASTSACQLFSGQTSCGWSDKVAVTCKKISEVSLKTVAGEAWEFVTGPCTWVRNDTNSSLPYCDSWLRSK